nr:YsnF/AvaK domain-containing protein [Solirubrobacterales bacterium]
HYGVDYGESRSDSGLPQGGTGTGERVDTDRDRSATTGRGVVGNDVSGAETDEAMTRSEEELRIGVARRETGRVRLRKHITTEPVSETVTTQREELRVEREPITDANIGNAMSGGDLTEEEHEVTLSAEEAIVEKRVVPKERVRMDKEIVSEQQTVTDEIRKEQIEVIDAAGEPAQGRDGVRGTDEGV